MKVYIVLNEEWPNTWIEAVCSSREIAEQYIKNKGWNSLQIEEWTIDGKA